MKHTLRLPLVALGAFGMVAVFATLAVPSVSKADSGPDVVTVWNQTMIGALETAKARSCSHRSSMH
jgi:hypothetical protein